MSISNHSVDLTASTADLERTLDSYTAQLNDLCLDDSADEAYIEWVESGVEAIEDELERRDYDFADGSSFRPAYDSPSLEDSGYTLGSYAS